MKLLNKVLSTKKLNGLKEGSYGIKDLLEIISSRFQVTCCRIALLDFYYSVSALISYIPVGLKEFKKSYVISSHFLVCTPISVKLDSEVEELPSLKLRISPQQFLPGITH